MTRHAFTLALAITATACVEVQTGVYEAPSDELAPYLPTAEQKTEVTATLQLLFDALETGDEALLRSVTDPSVVMHFTETREGITTFGSSTLDGLAERISSSEEPLIERFWDPIVVVNGSLATI